MEKIDYCYKWLSDNFDIRDLKVKEIKKPFLALVVTDKNKEQMTITFVKQGIINVSGALKLKNQYVTAINKNMVLWQKNRDYGVN